MKAMIMAAGLGTRLMPMTADMPKAMVPMMNRPLMVNIIELLASHGFTEIVVNLHYKGEVISDYFGDGRDFGVEMHYSPEQELLGTAGGVKKCASFLDDTFVVVSGDALTDADLGELLQAHRRCGALATIALKEVEQVESFGIVVLDESGRVASFQEKPTRAEALSATANTGIYVFEPEIFQHIPDNAFYDFGSQLFPALAERSAPLYGAVMPRYWCDVGGLELYRRAHADILEGRVAAGANGQLLVQEASSQVFAGPSVEAAAGVCWEGTVVVGTGCRIGRDVRIQDAVIWDNTVVEDGAQICGAVIGHHCRIGGGSTISAGSAVGSGVVIKAGSRVVENQLVHAPD